MFLFRDHFRLWLWLLVLISIWIPLSLPGNADELANYLDQHSLDELLAIHLESELERAEGDDRQALLHRLTSLYARLLEQVEDPARRLELQQRSRRLLELAPDENLGELRLALLQGSYRSAETIAEQHRLRLADDDEVTRAKEILTEVIPQLVQLRHQLADQIELIDKRISRQRGRKISILTDESDRVHRLLDQCKFLNAWALYYQSYLHDRPDNARVAVPLFAEILGIESTHPQPNEVSLDLRGSESFARAILGLALCKSLTSSSSTALAWLSLLDHDQAFAPLRKSLPAWQMTIYFAHDDFTAAHLVLEDSLSDAEPVPVSWLRLAAVSALESRKRTRSVDELLQQVLEQLAVRGELPHILDLAKRYGLNALGGSGFIFQYVNGVLKYQDARDAHDDNEPTLNPYLQQNYEVAIDEFELALTQSDADQFMEMSAACQQLMAWCYYFQSQFIPAKTLFIEASEKLPAREAPEALWMAVVSLQKAIQDQQDTKALLTDELAQLIDHFLLQFPQSEYTPRLLYQQTTLDGTPTIEKAQLLLSIEPGSEMYQRARERAARMLYQLFRQAAPEQRMSIGSEYLAVAGNLLSNDKRQFTIDDPVTVAQFNTRCRCILEISLDKSVKRSVAAKNALLAWDEIESHSDADFSVHHDEIDYRRVQYFLLIDDTTKAAYVSDQLHQNSNSSVWSVRSQKAMLREARLSWRDETAPTDVRIAAVDRMIKFGQRVLDEDDENDDQKLSRTQQSIQTAVAEAYLTRWERIGEEVDGRQSLSLFEQLLLDHPRNAHFLRSTAILNGAFDDPDRALECWRLLVAGLPEGGGDWYEAKFNVIDLLSRTDPIRARNVMDQHKLLHPEYGPDPWGARLRVLDARIDRRLEASVRFLLYGQESIAA